jgi:hypothetical protein
MLNANSTCQIRKASGFDVYGKPKLGPSATERCCVLRLVRTLDRTMIRSDSSRTNAHGEEFVVQGKLMLDARTVAQPGDQLTAQGVVMKVFSMFPRLDALTGQVDHYETELIAWGS